MMIFVYTSFAQDTHQEVPRIILPVFTRKTASRRRRRDNEN